ncbi:hypothetical protein M4I21_10180 [Cellulophaga sp. 20_2_10]|uniref:DUF6913 domain-containing protein n=1 Tax=Cellulophaga sp. 20_2_10 TaxID=2942476 RepID=UPI00201AADB1|nr:hypothetical protein [Cellulophaga sp. 20_2_10]MCL5246175.1 hypothetical protein [Cellulophaga sp. 20_2_10]
MLKGIKNKLKRKAALKFLNVNKNKVVACSRVTKGISKIGCIVDLDSFADGTVFNEFIKEFSLQPNALKIIGYKKEQDKNSPYSTPVFSEEDLGWGAKIENSYALEFLDNEYDLLINYYAEDNLLLQLMTVQAKARLKVGFGEVDEKLNDLILNVPIKDFSIFKKELGKYLSVLNEIK